MIGWWCAVMSFWGAAGLLGLLAALDAFAVATASRRPTPTDHRRRAGQPAR
jgi:hypothetical protein